MKLFNFFEWLVVQIKQLVSDFLEERKKEKAIAMERKAVIEARQHEIFLKRLEVEEKRVVSGVSAADNDTLNDKEAIEQMERSWKDEIIMFILFTPIIISFIPFSQDSTSKGFEILGKVPEWYMLLVTGITVAIYGLRGVVRVVSQYKKPTI